MKKTKIICTMGPSTNNVELLTKMIGAGMNLARFNFSHGTHEGHAASIKIVREAAKLKKEYIALIADTRGPEMRLGLFENDEVLLNEGDSFCLTTKSIVGTKEIASVNYDALPSELNPGDSILLADGMLALAVEKIAGDCIYTKVIHGGVISSRKRVACPGVELNLPFLSEADISDITFAAQAGMDYVAASFVQKAEDVLAIRKILEQLGSEMGIISKIENQAGVENIDSIIAVSDGIMVARGDLGVEIPSEIVPIVQKKIISKCNKAGKPVVTATQMLESMISSFRATRAEASDVANAILDGTDVIMLSGETASGKFPLEAVQTMARIAETIEQSLDYETIFRNKGLGLKIHSTEAISHATVQMSQELISDAIVTVTTSGFTARMVSKYRPKAKVIAVSPSEGTVRRMQLYWGVYPVLGQEIADTDKMIQYSLDVVQNSGYVKYGDSVIVTAGVPVGRCGSTNLIKVVKISHILATGTGVGKAVVSAKICKCHNVYDLEHKFTPGDILLIEYLPEEAAKYAVKAAAIITEESGLTSPAAIVAVTYGIPSVVGVSNALQNIPDGIIVTVDSVSGTVYEAVSKN